MNGYECVRTSPGTGSGSRGGQPGRAAFGVAKPMQGGGPAPRPDTDGGDQFPPLDALSLPGAEGGVPVGQMDAMQRLADRQNASGDAGSSRVEGFETSIHKIKEQVLPACSSASTPRLPRRWARTSWPRNSARSSARCSPS